MTVVDILTVVSGLTGEGSGLIGGGPGFKVEGSFLMVVSSLMVEGSVLRVDSTLEDERSVFTVVSSLIVGSVLGVGVLVPTDDDSIIVVITVTCYVSFLEAM